MHPFSFVLFLFFSLCSISITEALASRQFPSSGISAVEQASFGGYSYGESCLFGGSGSFATNNLWSGKQGQPYELNENKKEIPPFPTTFIPNKTYRASSSGQQ